MAKTFSKIKYVNFSPSPELIALLPPPGDVMSAAESIEHLLDDGPDFKVSMSEDSYDGSYAIFYTCRQKGSANLDHCLIVKHTDLERALDTLVRVRDWSNEQDVSWSDFLDTGSKNSW